MSVSTLSSQDPLLFDSQYYVAEQTDRSKWLLWIVMGLALLGLGISGYLTWTTIAETGPAGCSGDAAGCDHVLTSPWSKWLGMPVSLFGLLTYAGILAASIMSSKDDQGYGPTLLLTLALTAAGSATWFIGLQVFELGHYCVYCMTVHGCSLLICTLTIIHFWFQGIEGSNEQQMGALLGVAASPPAEQPEYVEPGARIHPLIASGVAAGGVLVLMLGQFFFRPSGMTFEAMDVAAAEQPAPTETVSEGFDPEDSTKMSEATSEPQLQPSPSVEETVATETDPVETSSDDKATLPWEDEPTEPTADEPRIGSFEEPFNSDSPTGDALLTSAGIPDEDLSSGTVLLGEEQQPDLDLQQSAAQDSPRLIQFGGLKEPIDVTNVPILGNPYAKHVLVEMLDYTCPHCRHLHPHVEASLERYGDQVAFVVVHVPLSKKCNPYIKRDHWSHKNACDYARLAVSVWKLDREKFPEFHSYVMKGERPPSNIDARHFAMKLVGEEVFDQALKADSLRSFAGNSDDMKKMHSGLPLLLTTKGKVRGVPNNERDWFNFLETQLGILPIE